jgi:ER-bound oxygenase mpaB/B'/Rubber oxygenase, catalytic domain
VDGNACNPPGVPRGEEGDHAANVVGLGKALERLHAQNEVRPTSVLVNFDIPAGRWTDRLCRRHCQSKFYTACSRTRAGWSSTVFARELPPRSAEFNAENRLYSFALTMPSKTVDDPIGRFHRTFAVVFTMVFGTLDQALSAARALHRRHAAIHGRLPITVGLSAPALRIKPTILQRCAGSMPP